MSGWGPGARGIVWGTRVGQEGHVFNVVNQAGAIRFLDGQAGGAAALESFDSLFILRTH
jgi:filamentous hemagglutinin